MENSATVFSAEIAEMPTRKFGIVPKAGKSADKPMSPRTENVLRDYVKTIMKEEGLSYQAIETNALKHGYSISRGTVQGIAREDDPTDNPGIYTLVALAYGLGRTIEEVLVVALGDELKSATSLQKGELAAISELAKQLSAPADFKFYRRLLQMVERELRFMLRGE